MTQEEILAILDSISAGQEVAEHETELPRVFIADVEVYRRLVNDEVDLITGGKGSGKSAIYRMITETKIAEGLEVISASNPSGSPAFRALFTGNDSEERLRSIWAVYFASLVGNYVVDTYADIPPTATDVKEIQEILELMGLRKRKKAPGTSLLERIRRSTSVGGELKGGAAGFELGIGLKFDLPAIEAAASSTVVLEYPDFFELMKKCADVLAAHQSRVWIAIDRLDECFVRNSEVERRALRALLRTVLDCGQALEFTPWVRIKVFLRTDMFTKFTEDGAFTNATHLRRNDISWTFKSMADLIAHRMMKNDVFADAYLANTAAAEHTRVAWEAMFPAVGGKRPGSRPGTKHERYSTSDQFCLWTSDGSRLYNPRNVIALVNLALHRARENQRRAIALGRANRQTQPLVVTGEVNSAMGELGRRRLQDTVQNEFPLVVRFVARLDGGPSEFATRDGLAKQLGLEESDAVSIASAIDSLVISGVIGPVPGGRFIIPWMYRPAMHTAGAGRSGQGRRSR